VAGALIVAVKKRLDKKYRSVQKTDLTPFIWYLYTDQYGTAKG
jgi:hypothetical protein